MKPFGLKVRRYAARMIDLNDYLCMFPKAKVNGKKVLDRVK